MTSIEILSPREAERSLFDLTGANPMSGITVAELVRDVISSYQLCGYQSLLREVVTLISPVRRVDHDVVRVVIDALDADGDVVINGGTVAATPIRAVQLDDLTFKFMSSLSARRLARLFPGDWRCHESTRVCHPIEPAMLPARIAANGGVLLTAEGWAGLNREPAADEAWLATLEQQLVDHSHPPESETIIQRLDWEWLSVGAESLAWRKEEPLVGTRLWRGRSARGYWIHALTSAGSPVNQPWLQLRRDEAHRMIFALARTAGLTVPLSIRQEENLVELTIPPFLPDAEFRYLTVASRLRHSAPHAVRWKFSPSRAPQILEILERRLGLSAGH